MGASALDRAFDGLTGLPIAALGTFPTPVENAPALGALAGLDLWIKRDDQSGQDYGGNKIRKLELLLGRALAKGVPGVVTTGAWGSHHVLATAVCAKKLGLDATAVLIPQPQTDHVLENLLATHGAGAKIVAVGSSLSVSPVMLWHGLAKGAMMIPPGGSSSLGALAYAGAAFELAEQIERGACPRPERMYVALGSSGTMAGLVLGVHLAGLDGTEVVGVRVTPRGAANELTVAFLATSASRLLASKVKKLRPKAFAPWHLRVVHTEYGDGYGHPTADAETALRRAREHAGVSLDLTYTAKALAGLFSDCHRRPPKGPVMFWNTLSSTDIGPLVAKACPQTLPDPVRGLFS